MQNVRSGFGEKVQWKKTFLSAFAAQIISIVGFAFAYPFLPYFISELGVAGEGEQVFWAGMVLAAEGFTMALFAPFWGVVSDRYGRKLIVCISMFGGTVVVFLMSFVQTVGQLMVCRLLEGAVAGTMAASLALVASVTPQRRSGFALGMMQSAVLIGASIGPFLGGIAADALGYRATFRWGALLIFFGGLLAYFGIFENFERPLNSGKDKVPGFRQIFLIKGFAAAVLVIFGVKFSNTVVNPSFPLIIKDMLPALENLNSITGSIMGAAAFAGALSAAFLGLAGDRIGYRRILTGCCLGACIASTGHYFARSLEELFMFRILFGLAVAGMLPAANAMIRSIINCGSIGKAYGLANSISITGLALGPLIGGYVAKSGGLRVPFLVSASLHLLLFFMVIALFRPPRENTPAEPA